MTHKITIKNQDQYKEQITTWSNLDVLLDGNPLNGLQAISFSVKVGEISEVVIKMVAEVDMIIIPQSLVDEDKK